MAISSLAEIDKSDSKKINEIEASIVEILNEGSPESKRPIKFVIKLEGSGEIATCATWDYNLLAILKMGLNDMNVYNFKANANMYNNELQFKVTSCYKTDVVSTKKETQITVDQEDTKSQIQGIINKYVKNQTLLSIANQVLANDDFFIRPAAKRCHHAFPGGLAMHTLGVMKMAMNIYRSYYDKVSLELIIVGALIHDMGKIYEYSNDGEITYEGSFVGHIPFGIAMLTDMAANIGLSVTDPIILQLMGIISSHHFSLENGSPSRPSTLEAVIVAYADQVDAGMEGGIEALTNIPLGGKTMNGVKSLDDCYLIKINNKDLIK